MNPPAWLRSSPLFPFALPLLLALNSCTQESGSPPPPPLVTVTPVQEREIQDFVVFTGRTEAVQTVDVRARVSGYLTETKFKDGQDVKKGDVLFVIDPRPYQADLDRAQAEFDKAQADLQLAGIEYNRSRELRQKNAISAQDFDGKAAAYLKAQGGLASAKADLDTSKLNLEFTSITAPIDGQTSKAAITPGNLVTPDMKEPLTVIVSTNPIYAYADIDERQLLKYIRLQNSERKAGDAPEQKQHPETPIHLQLADEKGFPTKGISTSPTTGSTAPPARSRSAVSSRTTRTCSARACLSASASRAVRNTKPFSSPRNASGPTRDKSSSSSSRRTARWTTAVSNPEPSRMTAGGRSQGSASKRGKMSSSRAS
ncbi:MAG: efflux RND transporter periplasmic adaptor subunit [Terrimicrobiaceae bacterium]|nr:efflux RND transporter periplasmic adaptor subunit [Terrimicrobiaceae bacterium]